MKRMFRNKRYMWIGIWAAVVIAILIVMAIHVHNVRVESSKNLHSSNARMTTLLSQYDSFWGFTLAKKTITKANCTDNFEPAHLRFDTACRTEGVNVLVGSSSISRTVLEAIVASSITSNTSFAASFQNWDASDAASLSSQLNQTGVWAQQIEGNYPSTTPVIGVALPGKSSLLPLTMYQAKNETVVSTALSSLSPQQKSSDYIYVIYIRNNYADCSSYVAPTCRVELSTK